MKIYGDLNSGNCLKVKWVSDRLALPYRWIDVDTMKGGSRTPQFLKLNGAGQVPVVELDDGRALAQSNAIIRYLARDSDLIPREGRFPSRRLRIGQALDRRDRTGAWTLVRAFEFQPRT